MKKILILGASSDVGSELVKYYINKNFHVIAHCNKNSKKLKKIKKKNFKIMQFDLRKINNFEKFVKNNKIFNDIDIFVSLTGYLKIKKIKDVNVKDFTDHFNVNYLSNFIVTQKIINSMIKKNWGRIVYASSIGTKFGGSNNSFVYSLSKFMNEFFPRPLRNLTKNNILINTLQVGLTDTKLNKIDKNKDMKKRISLIPLNRMAKIKEVIRYIYFLTSEENSLISNEVINISGGE
jgi:3-oxoacyl-[acyl-carrier protein] reductase|tara:strand:+ start:1279 stop:1983 length:705 start_codon:yes stop_codon:yes gene_type:complete